MRMCMADGIHERVFGPIGVEPRVSNILVPVTHSVLQGLFLSGGKSMNFQDMIFALKNSGPLKAALFRSLMTWKRERVR